MERILMAWHLYRTGRLTEAQLDNMLAMAEVVNRVCGERAPY